MRNLQLFHFLAPLIISSPSYTNAWIQQTTSRKPIKQLFSGNKVKFTSTSTSALFFETQQHSWFHSSATVDTSSSKNGVIDKPSFSTRSKTTKLDAAAKSIVNSLPLAGSPKAVIAISIIGHILGGLIGLPFVVRATKGPFSWYGKIKLPSWTPPDAIFGPVWSTLYALMGLAMGRLWNATASTPQKMNILTLSVWAVHCALNILWAPVFFGMKKLRLGCIISGLLIATLIPVILLLGFFVQPAQPVSAALLLPYLGWITFATFLNAEICKQNPTAGSFGGYNEAQFQADLARLQQQAARYAFGK